MFLFLCRSYRTVYYTGKGDLVGCDISVHLLASSNGQGVTTSHNPGGGQEVFVKSSSDVKVSVIFKCKISWALG